MSGAGQPVPVPPGPFDLLPLSVIEQTVAARFESQVRLGGDRPAIHTRLGVASYGNGEVVIDGGDHTGALPGRVLRRPISHTP